MNITIIKSKRKTVSIQVNADLSVTVRAPVRASNREIERILKVREPWILKQIERIQREKADYERAHPNRLTREDIKGLAENARVYIPERVRFFAGMMGVDYGRITIRSQRTLWGSCSSSGNLSFNCLLMLAPPEVVDYVVVHELCHRIHMNHSKAFWSEVEKVLPEYREQVRWLKTEGRFVIKERNE